MYKTHRLGKLEEEFEKKFNSLPQYSPLTFDKKSVAVTKKKKNSTSSPPEPPKPCKGEFTACMETDITSSWPPHSFLHLLTFLGSSHLMFRMTWLPPNIACCVVFLFLFYCLKLGSSSSQKKTLFHKIVNKYKHRKEKSSAADKGDALTAIRYQLHSVFRWQDCVSECWKLCLHGVGCCLSVV